MKNKNFSNVENAAFCSEMSMILKSGISTTEGLFIMQEEAESESEKKLLNEMIEAIQTNGYLYIAMEEQTVFPKYMIHMVQIGEETGTLDDVMNQLASHYNREEQLHRSIVAALFYPMIIIGLMIVVVFVLLVKVMPIFNQVFRQLGTEMTGISKSLVDLGNSLNRYGMIFIILLAVLVVGIFVVSKMDNGKNRIKSILYRFGFTKDLMEKMAACRFAEGLSLTSKSGLSYDQGLELVSTLNEDTQFQTKIDLCLEKVNQGSDLAEAVKEADIFKGVYSKMVALGFKTGSLDQVMSQIADLYQEEIDTRINNVLAVLEPSLVVALSLIVGAILLSVMLPLMGIMSSL